ncbi:MAG: DUF1552 domain-containing protein [Polyangiales bacterium]|nr:DUF1552 domain-containing protein [Myxococcales bacterium]MCB9658200.1 DUF1552 domain-containing protein [Sandaracinaceae bacterium]
MRSKKLSRRTMLKGILGGGAAVTIGMPMLEMFCNGNGTALADGSPFPKRFGAWIWGNGNIPERWTPLSTGRDYALSEQLRGLAPVRSDVTVVSGTIAASVAREPHLDGSASFLSGTPITSTGQHTIEAATIDVIARERIGGVTAFSSLQAGVQPGLGNSTVSVNGPGSANPATVDPLTLYQLIFGEGFALPGEEPVIDPMWQLRRSALSSVMEESASLRAQLGTHDQRRLDEHLTGVRELELRLLRFEEDPPNLASCALPAVPAADYPEVNSRPQMSVRHRLMADMLTMAMACDRTRVVHMMFTPGGSNVRFPGVATGHHELSHKIDAVSQDQLTLIVQQIIDEYAYFVQALANVPEGDGRLLDNLALLATSDCSFGAEHEITEYPILIAGNAGGALVTGQHLRAIGEVASKVSFSLLRAVGATVDRFGVNEAEATTGLSGLEV